MIVTYVVASTAVAVAAGPAQADATAYTYRVTVQVAGTRRPLAQTRVLLVPADADEATGELSAREHLDPKAPPPAWVLAGETAEDGSVEIAEVPASKFRVVVLAGGYERLETIVDLGGPRSGNPATLFVVADPDNAYRTEVAGPREPRSAARPSQRVLTPEEIRTVPGTQGDPLRALQNFPGVARPPGGLGLLVLRGASPNQSRVFYGEHALPRAFHALAFSSVVPADAIGSIAFLPGNAPSRYGDLTGGVVDIRPRRLPRDGVHGYGEIDLAGTGAMVRGPLGKGTFFVAAQRGWVDLVLRAAERVDDTQTFTLPNYYDYQALTQYPLSSHDEIEVRILGAGDRIQTRSFDPANDERVVPLEVGVQFHRADFVWRHRRGDWRFVLSPTFRFESARVEQRLSAITIRRDYFTGWRAEAQRRLSRRTSLTVGTDGEVAPFRTRLIDIVTDFTPVGLSNPREGDVERAGGLQSSFGVYTQLDARFGRVSIVPGLRASAFTLGDDVEAAVDPRLGTRVDFSDRWSWRFGVGLYSQGVVAQRVSDTDFVRDVTQSIAGNVILPASIRALEPRAGFQPATGSLRVARAPQVSTGVRFEPNERWAFETGAYGRLRANVDGADFVTFADGNAIRFRADDTYNVDYGLEALARLRPVGRLYGWLAYTLSRSETRFVDAVREDDAPLSSPFDQRHVLTLLASYALPRNWRIGGRFRLVSGSPYTPIIGLVEVPSQENRVLLGRENSARFPVFHQLDLRVDKQWIKKRSIITFYMDVQNVYNRTNIEAYVYDFEFRERINGVGLPIFPSLGFRIDL